jgi:DNA-binding NarL/FixJ family response regulator
VTLELLTVEDRIAGPASDPSIDDPGAGDALRVVVVAAYPAGRAGLAALLAEDPSLLPVEPLGMASRRQSPGEQEMTEPMPAAIVVDLNGLPEHRLDDLSDAYPGVPFVLLGGNPASDGPGLGGEPIAYLSQEADGPTLSAAVRGVGQGLTVLDPSLVVSANLHAHPVVGQPTESSDVLTAREREVLMLVADGYPNKAIARELGISEHTAKFHVGSLLAKLNAGSRTEAVTVATRRGLLTV